MLHLRYEARDIDQAITSQQKIDEWFDAKTQGLNDLAKAQLKQKWGTMQRVLSSRSRLENIFLTLLSDRMGSTSISANFTFSSGWVVLLCQIYLIDFYINGQE